jgi:8-oxo-dGTP diphosphatase
VLLVHRPRHDGWSWPKGKLEPGETLPGCAVRETAEETGTRAVLGRPLSTVEYQLPDGRPKRVTYWAGRAAGFQARTASEHEIDQTRWMSPAQARERLSKPSDQAPLTALLAAYRENELATRPVIVIRHAVSRPRDSWARADADRPLVATGRRQALALACLLSCWQPEYVLTSPWRRCLETLEPYLATSGARVRTKGGLSEDGHRRDPAKAGRHAIQLLRRESAALLCTHRQVLEPVLAVLRTAADPEPAALIPGTDPFLVPAEVLVTHAITGSQGSRVVAVEKHLPPR